MVALAVLVLLPFHDVDRGGAAVLRAVTEVELEPEVAGLQVGALRGPEAVNRGRAGRQDVALLGGRG
jgi:hypothetical protein